MKILKVLLNVPLWGLLLFSLIGCGRATPIQMVRRSFPDVPGGTEPTPSAVPTPTPTGQPISLVPVPVVPPPPQVVPQPLPALGALACTIERSGFVTEAGQPLALTLSGTGAIQGASINGIPVTAGQPVAVPPILDGTYIANGMVIGPGGATASCQFIFQPPRCTLTLLEQSAQQVRVEMLLQGAIAFATINNQGQQLTPQNRIQFAFAPQGPGTVSGLVESPAGDEGSCSVDYDFPISTQAGQVTPYYFTDGFNTAGTSSFIMGGGVKSTYGFWSAVPGTSTLPIHTGANVQRANDCAAGEVVVGFGSSNIKSPWAQSICSPLVPGLELYDSRVLYVAWSAESNGSCATGEVLTGATFEFGAEYGQWGGRLALKCSKLRWEE